MHDGPLGLVKAACVRDALEKLRESVTVSVIPMPGPARAPRTSASPSPAEQALLDGCCDVTVRHVKDMPAVPLVRPGIVVAAYPQRGDVRDALVHPGGLPLDRLLPGTTIGTTSVRRAAYLARSHPHLKVMPVLGSVEQRLKALEAREVDALVVASHALDLLGQEHRASEWLAVERLCPPLGAAATALQCRNDDEETIAVVGRLDHTSTRREIDAERMLRCVLRTGAHAPAAGFCTTLRDGRLSLRGVLFQPDGGRFVASHQRGTNPMDLGMAVGFDLLSSRGHHLIAAREAHQ
ncbi:hydroxymethylbilane synthase [Streptomyces olivoreticuli]|uniref:hydroxymethylbilane synthase n=1 Tax=Streptomyces olivoreticuli TaxID=68246 RepID=UPI001F07BB20|nr:hydroxymethylbilane synthase [Streptomyces olivoreticuli]